MKEPTFDELIPLVEKWCSPIAWQVWFEHYANYQKHYAIWGKLNSDRVSRVLKREDVPVDLERLLEVESKNWELYQRLACEMEAEVGRIQYLVGALTTGKGLLAILSDATPGNHPPIREITPKVRELLDRVRACANDAGDGLTLEQRVVMRALQQRRMTRDELEAEIRKDNPSHGTINMQRILEPLIESGRITTPGRGKKGGYYIPGRKYE